MTALSRSAPRTCTATSTNTPRGKLLWPPVTTTVRTTWNIPGEDLPKVLHYYKEPHPYFDMDVLIVGGKNSAAIAALDLWRHGARVTLVHRGPEIHRNVKYWILPDIENRIKNGEITAYFNSSVLEIGQKIRAHQDSGRRARDQKRFCLCHDRLPSRLRFSGVAGH